MTVLVDTSGWIDYFRGGKGAHRIDDLIDEDTLVTNDLILAELVPFLKIRNQRKVIELLNSIPKLALSIDWNEIVEDQYKCLKNGLNGVGIPDLIVAQNARQNNCPIYTLDAHFHHMKTFLPVPIVVS